MSDHQNHFYDGLGLDLWRQAISPEDTLAEVDFLVEALDLDAPARLLDLPCGNGRHALPLAEEGFQVTGLDRSEAFLEEAKTQADDDGLELTLRNSDIRTLDYDEAFDGAYCLGNSLSLFDRIGMARFFNGVARALVPGGRFVMESGNLAECLLPNFEERLWYPVGNLLVLMENSYDPAEGLLETNYTIIRDPGAPDGGNNGHAPFQPGRPQLEARHETRQLRQWIYSLSEIRHMLGEAGLGLAGFCADTDGAPFDMGCERVFIVAEKV
jgi:SAM-dependent methyltransferase|tara:strand:+ start:1936 stop:2742 length:807 start_codon:yes stop_codon:yes gene_type:complete